MSFYSLPETLHHEISTIQVRFFWAGDGDKQEYHIPLDRYLPTARPGRPRDHVLETHEYCPPDALALADRKWGGRPLAPDHPEQIPAGPAACFLSKVWRLPVLVVRHPVAPGPLHWDFH